VGVALVALVLAGLWWRSRGGSSVVRDATPAAADTSAAGMTSDSTMRKEVDAYDSAPAVVPAAPPSKASMLRGIPTCPYRLQVSSVHDSVAADAVGQRLATLTQLRYEVVADRKGPTPWYAVMLGPFRTLDEAEAARAGIQSVDPDVRGTVLRTSATE
jgi:septal ring-binding cell division protein DamX